MISKPKQLGNAWPLALVGALALGCVSVQSNARVLADSANVASTRALLPDYIPDVPLLEVDSVCRRQVQSTFASILGQRPASIKAMKGGGFVASTTAGRISINFGRAKCTNSQGMVAAYRWIYQEHPLALYFNTGPLRKVEAVTQNGRVVLIAVDNRGRVTKKYPAFVPAFVLGFYKLSPENSDAVFIYKIVDASPSRAGGRQQAVLEDGVVSTAKGPAFQEDLEPYK